MCGHYCMTPQGPAQVLGLIFLQLAQCTQEGMNTSPYKINKPPT